MTLDMERGVEGQVGDHQWFQCTECGREKKQNMGHRDGGEIVFGKDIELRLI